MISAASIPAPATVRRIHLVQILTIGWMSIEAAVSLYAAFRSRSPALAAFGGDSAIELLSAAVVLRRFRGPSSESAEHHAARIAGVLLIALAAYIALASALSLLGYIEPQPTLLGIIILLAAAVIMPSLAREKRRLSALTASAALRADAAQSGLCAYLSVIALAGLAVHSLWHVSWADPLAALALIPLILVEARECTRGKPCDCC